jgi:hypothetical protein
MSVADGVRSDLAEGTNSSLLHVIETFQQWMYLPDPGPVLVTLATVAANRMDGDPVWTLLIGPAGSAKSETLQSLEGLHDVHPAGTLTEAGLLSGTPSRERDVEAKGGLLPTMGEFGIILAKDFTSVLQMHRDGRQRLLAALREIYDGSWTRILGSDGGIIRSWKGKVGFLGGCTEVIDRHHAVMATMGERFLLYRMPRMDETEQAHGALAHARKGALMRRELALTTTGFLSSLDLPAGIPEAEDRDRLVALASLVARCRSAVERSGYHRDIELIPGPEAPTRIIIALDRLRAGLVALGLTPEDVWRLVVKVGLDCMPVVRHALLDLLWGHNGDPTWSFSRLAEATGYSTSHVSRQLEDLKVHGIAVGSGTGNVTEWQLSDRALEWLQKATGETDTSGGDPDSSGDPTE